VFSAVAIFWCLAAIALAALAFRRVNAGRVGLVVSAAVAGLVGVLTLVGLVHAVAAFTVLVLLYVGGANQWYADDPPPRPQPPAPTPGDKPPVW
jgi:hypothetical protein